MCSPRPFQALSAVLACFTSFSFAQSNIDPSSPHAWQQNTGWTNFYADGTNGVVFGESYLSGFAWNANTGWINFGDGSPTNGHTYSNGVGDHGVNHDGQGNLTGYAWSQNVGWINFEWATPGDFRSPTVSLAFGTFGGYAWVPNTGWLNFAASNLTAASMSCPDSDGDQIADHWEQLHFGNLSTANATSNQDGDGVSDLDEYLADSNPLDSQDFLQFVDCFIQPDSKFASLAWTSSPSRIYRIEYSTDLGQSDPWGNDFPGDFAGDTFGSTTFGALIWIDESDKLFFRVRPVRPLTP